MALLKHNNSNIIPKAVGNPVLRDMPQKEYWVHLSIFIPPSERQSLCFKKWAFLLNLLGKWDFLFLSFKQYKMAGRSPSPTRRRPTSPPRRSHVKSEPRSNSSSPRRRSSPPPRRRSRDRGRRSSPPRRDDRHYDDRRSRYQQTETDGIAILPGESFSD